MPKTQMALLPVLRETVVGLVRQDQPDLSARQLAVLLMVHLEDSLHTVRGMAARLEVAKPAITRALDRLEEFDLVARRMDPRDRRSVLATRTAAGADYVAKVKALMAEAAAAQGKEPSAEPSPEPVKVAAKRNARR